MTGKPKYFADTHVESGAIRQLRLKGLDILRCEDVGLAEVDDNVLLDYATEITVS